MSIFLARPTGSLPLVRSIPVAAFAGRPLDYGLPEPPKTAVVTLNDMFRFIYRASALRCSVEFFYTMHNGFTSTDYFGSTEKTILRNGPDFIEPTNGEAPSSRSISENIIVGELGQVPFVQGVVPVQVRPQEGDPYTFESSFSLTIAVAQSHPPGMYYFLNRQGVYSCPFLFAEVAGLSHGISGNVFGSEYRTQPNPSALAQGSGQISVQFSGEDLPLL